MKILKEMAILKEVNRVANMKSINDAEPSKNDIIISIMADLQQKQDQETELQLKEMNEMVSFSYGNLPLVCPLDDAKGTTTSYVLA